MSYSIFVRADALVLSLLVFAGMLVFFMLGRLTSRLFTAKRKGTEEQVREKDDGGPLENALFALFGFILAFAFGFSGNRYYTVRDILIDEADQIGTAVLRADLYPDSARQLLRQEFKKYVDARIELYGDIHDTAGMARAKQEGAAASANLWRIVTWQSKQPNMLIPSSQMIPAMNAMFDIASKREVILNTAVPDPIVVMLIVLAMASSFIAGITTKTIKPKDWIIIGCYVLFASLIIYITLDLGRPMRGLIQVKQSEQAILELRNMFK